MGWPAMGMGMKVGLPLGLAAGSAERRLRWFGSARVARLPPYSMRARHSSSHVARFIWPGTMPRSRQISTRTAPIGRRRSLARISSGVGRPGEARILGRGGRLGGARLAWGRQADGRRLQVPAAGGAPAEPGFERGGAEQTAGDAGEDQREIAGAEDCGDEGEAGEDMRVGGMLAQRVGEVLAVGDERADEAEDLADALRHGPIGIGLDGCDRGGGGVEHERNKNIKRGQCQGIFSGACRRAVDRGA